MTLALLPWIVVAYLLGSVPTSYLAARLVGGVDLRRVGSGNLGATNLYRVLGWKYAVPVGMIDAAKGAVPVLVLAPWAGAGSWGRIVLGLAAVLGHAYPVFLGFRGGKGVATSAGVVLGLAPLAFGVSALVWVAVVRGTGYVSLGSILAALVFPVSVALLYPTRLAVLWLGAGLAVLILGLHRANIRRLVQGTEHRFGSRARDRSEPIR